VRAGNGLGDKDALLTIVDEAHPGMRKALSESGALSNATIIGLIYQAASNYKARNALLKPR
jgi:hypothetical protein